jgi:hypothetical protein
MQEVTCDFWKRRDGSEASHNSPVSAVLLPMTSMHGDQTGKETLRFGGNSPLDA